jgi:hypothetical protein
MLDSFSGDATCERRAATHLMRGDKQPTFRFESSQHANRHSILYTQQDQRDEYLRMLAKLRDRRFWFGLSTDGFTMNEETKQQILNIEAAIANIDLDKVSF